MDTTRIFHHFPSNAKCPVCGTNEDHPCVLIPIDGTQEGTPEAGREECLPVHSNCALRLRMKRIPGEALLFYQFVDQFMRPPLPTVPVGPETPPDPQKPQQGP